ncbi:MAG: ATP-binding protein [Pseudomonadota bacterium]|nr:ATP-binding protein [Pseudomonadota bacterium]
MKLASLHARLRWLILIVLAAVLLPLAILSFHLTVTEVDELSDGRLAQSARTLQVLIKHAGVEALGGKQGHMLLPIEAAQTKPTHMHGDTYESEVGFQIFDQAGEVTLATANLASLPPPHADAPDFEDVVRNGYRWRVYTLRDKRGAVLVRAGERYDSRQDITHALWLQNILPLLIGLPLLALLIGWALRRGLRPLESLTRLLSAREPGSRQPVQLADAPLELQPMVAALNGQLGRLEDALERERRFSADVAHELRTPLATAMINLESAAGTDDPSERDTLLGQTQLNVAGLARRIEQLLALARLEAGAASGQRAPVDLVALAEDVIEELAPLIADSGVQLSLERPQPQVIVQGYEAALSALLRNLVENALRHVPGGGQVQLSIQQSASESLVDVMDDGPGIPAEHRASVFNRFHREAGSQGDGFGLGLSIVQRAAQLHGATIELLDSPYGNGLRVRVALPRNA